MFKKMTHTLGACFVAMLFSVTAVWAGDEHGSLPVDKVKGDLSVMVLGSGGPAATPAGRASAGYLIFVNRQPRILMDVGGGTFQRLAASGVNVKDLDIVLLSHLHIDHTGDLSSVVKTIYFHNRQAGTFRTAPIRVYGPDANGILFPPDNFPDATEPQYPSSTEYVDGHYDLNIGLERYLHVFAPAISGGEFAYSAADTSPDTAEPMRTLLDEDGLVVKAIGVVHGPVPALAYRIEYNGHSIVYSGDTNSSTENMITLAQGADLLIYDTAIMDDESDAVFLALHTTPTRMGEVAAAAAPGLLLLSHITPGTESRLGEVKDVVRAQGYGGKIKQAKDLKVFNLGDKDK